MLHSCDKTVLALGFHYFYLYKEKKEKKISPVLCDYVINILLLLKGNEIVKELCFYWYIYGTAFLYFLFLNLFLILGFKLQFWRAALILRETKITKEMPAQALHVYWRFLFLYLLFLIALSSHEGTNTHIQRVGQAQCAVLPCLTTSHVSQ